MSREININRQLLGLEDLLFGVGIVTQIRAGQNVDVTRINAGNLPFDETQTLLEWAQSINIEALGSMTTQLQAIYDNLTTIGNVKDNLTVINTLEDNLVALQSLYTNISKLQNIDTNMSKLQNIDTNMSKLQNIDTNMSKLQAIYIDLTKLESIYSNLTMLTAIYNNLTALNNITSQVIPNLTELLLVNDNAIQVAADKLTVATDKGIVAGYKNDVSTMKVAVESIYDTFDDRFLGVKASDPIVDNDGNTLNDGAMYFNGSSNALKVYSLDNTTWYTIPQIYLSGLIDVTLTSITTGDILTWNGTKWVNTTIDSKLDLHGRTAKTTLVDADEIMIADSASTWSLKKITWANIKTTLTSLFVAKVTSTDNAVVRFDGATGAVQNSTVIIDDSGMLTVQASQNSATVGVELLSNGTFTGSASGWTLGTNWAYSSNTVVCTLNASAEGTLSQNVSVVLDNSYLLEWYQTNSIDTNGQITPALGSVFGGKHSSGTTTQMYQQIFRATSTGSVSLSFTVTNITGTGTITIDSVSLKQITPMKPSMILNNTEKSVEKLEFRTSKNVGSIHPNIGIGNRALQNNTTGYSNTAVGGWALLNNTTGYNNTASGVGALYSNTTGNYNTASGVGALYSNTTGYNNTASGVNALQSNTTGFQNTASGLNALYSNTTGYNNTASGLGALYSNTTGFQNTASGVGALLNNTTGYNNTASGVNALLNNTTGNYNTASGVGALYSNTTGYNNTASGVNALLNNTTGNYNTASGVGALYSNTTGYNNTASGVGALQSNTIYSNISGFGYNSQVTGSNQVQLGDANTTTYVYGTVQNRSDIRDKADVRDTILGLDFIKSLRPVDYKWDMREDYKPERPELEVPKIEDEEYEVKKAEYDLLMADWLESCKHENIIRDGSKKRTRYHQGFIAQEVVALDVDFGGIQDHSVRGGEDVLSIGYDELIAPLVKAVQEQQAMIDALKARIETLEGAK